MAVKKNKGKKKKGFFSTLFVAVVFSAAIVLCLNPVMKLIYPLDYRDYIEKSAQKYSLDPYFVMGVISAESNFKEDAHSTKKAYGLMQIKDETALWCVDNFKLDINSGDIHLPENNIEIGCAYLDYLIKLYNGNVDTAVAAYNAGLGNVNRWLADKRYSGEGKTLVKIPFSETKEYVKKVSDRAKIYKTLYGR